MDIVTLLILMALFYLVPELLKRRRPKTHEYPQIPDRVPAETMPSPAPVKTGENVAVSFADKAAVAVTAQHEARPAEIMAVPSLVDEPPRLVRLDQAAVVNGIIFAEILQPPRAFRPLRRGGR